MAITPLWQRQITNFQNTQAQTGATPTAKERCESTPGRYWDWMSNACKSTSNYSGQESYQQGLATMRGLYGPEAVGSAGPIHDPYTNQIQSPTGQVIADKTYSNTFGTPVSQAPQNIGAALRTGSTAQTMGTPSGMGTFTEVNKNPLWWGENNFPAGTTLKDANEWCQKAGRGIYNIFKKGCQLDGEAPKKKPWWYGNNNFPEGTTIKDANEYCRSKGLGNYNLWTKSCAREKETDRCDPPRYRDKLGRCVNPDDDCPAGQKRAFPNQPIGPLNPCVPDKTDDCLPDEQKNPITGKCQKIASNAFPRSSCVDNGGEWVQVDPFDVNKGYCMGKKFPNLPTVQEIGNLIPGGIPSLNEADLNVEKATDQIPYMQLGDYGTALQNMLATPAFGGQTLDQLEQERINAMRQDLGASYGTMADDLTRRLNAEAAGAGMFTSGSRVQSIGQGLTDLEKERMTEEAKAIAEIRGERPELLLQERQQRAEIANLWGQLDLNAQGQNLDSFLQGRLMEYDRLFKNNQLTVDAFNSNINLMGLFLDYEISRAKTDAERAELRAQIDNIYGGLTLAQQNAFIAFLGSLTGLVAPKIGK